MDLMSFIIIFNLSQLKKQLGIYMNNIFYLTIILLVGCQSEVDKCTDLGIKAYGENVSKQEKAENEFLIRQSCMKAAAGKD